MSEGLPQLDNAAIVIPSAKRNFHEPVKIDPLELVTALSVRAGYVNNKSLILALRESTGRMPITDGRYPDIPISISCAQQFYLFFSGCRFRPAINRTGSWAKEIWAKSGPLESRIVPEILSVQVVRTADEFAWSTGDFS